MTGVAIDPAIEWPFLWSKRVSGEHALLSPRLPRANKALKNAGKQDPWPRAFRMDEALPSLSPTPDSELISAPWGERYRANPRKMAKLKKVAVEFDSTATSFLARVEARSVETFSV